jgi:signal transduction histidine kinase
MKKITILVFAFILNVSMAKADETGRYFMTFYTSEQTGGHFQNWSLIQDDRGVMYIGNGYGILEFDGSTWRLIPNSNKSFAFSFAKDSAGRIYVGSAAELGYLSPDSTGNMQYISLLKYIPEADRVFNYVWRVFALNRGILFQTRERIFLFTRGSSENGKEDTWKVNIWRPEKTGVNFTYSDYIDNTLYVFHSEKGIMKMDNDTLHQIPGGDKLVKARVKNIIKYPGHAGQYLVCTLNDGLWIYDGMTFKPLTTEADPLLKGSLQDAKILPNGNIAVCSLVHGLFILDQEGKIKLHLDSSSGLQSDVAKRIFIDRQGNIWLAMDGCIGMIEFNSDLAFYRMQGGGANEIVRFRGKIYAAAVTGIYYLDQKDSEFKPVPGIPKLLYNFFTLYKGHLISASTSGIYEVEASGGRCLFSDSLGQYGFSFLQPVSFDSTRFLAGGTNGFYLLKWDQKTNLLKFERKFQEFYEYVYVIREPEPGVFWLGTFDAGTIRVRFKNNDFRYPEIDKFGPVQGLSPGSAMVNLVAGKLVFSTNNGFYRYLPALNRFEPDPFFKDMKLGINPGEYPAVSDNKGNIWANSGKELVFYRHLADGSYRMEKGSFSRFLGLMVNYISPENNGTTWLGLNASIVSYKPSEKAADPESWNTIIRSVRITDDQPIYLGGGKGTFAISSPVKIPYKTNDVSFEYSGLSFIKPEYNEFSILLEGYDRNWSSWRKDMKHNYTNLPPGHYTFRVKCRNIIGQDGAEASFVFTIRTPWYRTVWAFCGYFILAVLSVYSLVRYRTRKLHERSRYLEKIVEQRTAQIQEQKENVEQLSKIGRDITSSLSIENIIQIAYENVNNLMDATVFTIGLYKQEEDCLEFPAAIEKNQLLPRFTIPLTDENRLAIWCYKNRQDVKIDNYALDYVKYVGQMAKPIAGESPESILYLPLWNKDKVIGVISVQSFSKNAYTDYHVNMLRNLATYSAIAMENADAYRHLAVLLDELRAAQDRLVTQSKLAALGEMSAGIAHEIQNPLNFVNNFSEINSELMDELKSELEKGNQEEANALINDIKQNVDKINYHGKRADSIVKSMLQHSLSSTGQKQPTDINNLTDEFFRLAYHGLRAKDKSFQASMRSDFDSGLGKVNVVTQDIGRVVLNLISNAFYAVTERKKLNQPDYEPTVWVSTKKVNGKIQISVKDNGIGIPQRVLDKIFQPFFTTKPAGEGTGLGLSLAYDIVTKGHGGELKFETKEGEGSQFIVQIPV